MTNPIIFPRFIPILALLLTAEVAAAATGGGHYRPMWKNFVRGEGFFEEGVVPFTGSREVALQNLRLGTTHLYLDLGFPTDFANGASAAAGSSIAFLPFAVVPVAVAYNTPSHIGVEFTLDQIGWLLRGDAPFTIATPTASPLSSADITPVLIRSSSTQPNAAANFWLHEVVRAGTDMNAPAFTSNFLALIEANTRIVWVGTEEEAASYVYTNANTMTFTTYPASVEYRLNVAGLRMPYTHGNASMLKYPKMHSADSTDFDASTGVTRILPQGDQPSYPFSIPAVLNIAKPGTTGCIGDKTAIWLKQFTSLLAANLLQWGLSPIDPFELNAGASFVFLDSAACSGAHLVVSRGSSAIQALVTGLSRLNLIRSVAGDDGDDDGAHDNEEESNEDDLEHAKTNPVFILYSGGGSSGGLRAIKDGTHVLVGSDSLFNEDEYVDYPSMQFIPFTSFDVGVFFNIPGVDELVLPRCITVGIFTGVVTHWDHPEIRRYNPMASLPHVPINVWARSSRSGTTGIFTTGLTALDQTCTNGTPTLSPSKTWTMNFTNLHTAAGTAGVIQGGAEMPYSIGYAGSSEIRAAGLPEASFVDERTGTFTAPTDEDSKEAVSRAELHPERLVLTLEKETSSNSYPFVGVSYVVYDANRKDKCDELKTALEFVKWSLTASNARAYGSANYFPPLPMSVNDASIAMINKAKCNDIDLFAVGEAASNNVMTIVLATVLPVVFIGLVGALVASRMAAHGKNNSFAPVGQDKVTIVFTDIENSTMLWARAPLAMGSALDEHNRIIRECIADHKCYEVKVIGDAFMIACKTPQQAVDLALSIQEELYKCPKWPREIDELYEEMYEEKGWATKRGYSDETLWNGLRVRVGIAHGQAAAKLDEISGGYDYYGNTVNMAARVEAVGHGGQVLIEEGLATALGGAESNEFKSRKATVTSLGAVQLKGLSGDVTLFQLCGEQFERRQFDELRVNHENVVDGFSPPAGSPAHTKRGSRTSESDQWAEAITKIGRDLGSSSRNTRPSSQSDDDADQFTSSARGGSHQEGGDSYSVTSNEESTRSDLRRRSSMSKTSSRIGIGLANGPDFIAALFQPLKDSQKRDIVEVLCAGWRIPTERKKVADILQLLTHRAVSVVKEARRHASSVSDGGSSARTAGTAGTSSRKRGDSYVANK